MPAARPCQRTPPPPGNGCRCSELGGVHPREGILSLQPFQALERLSMVGSARCAGLN